jgi:hypothetical protein
MTSEQLKAIRSRVNRATDETWYIHGDGKTVELRSAPSGQVIAELSSSDEFIDTDDLLFIRYARSDIPELLKHIDHLTSRLQVQSEINFELNQKSKRFLGEIERLVERYES